jgi:hypothetical protein
VGSVKGQAKLSTRHCWDPKPNKTPCDRLLLLWQGTLDNCTCPPQKYPTLLRILTFKIKYNSTLLSINGHLQKVRTSTGILSCKVGKDGVAHSWYISSICLSKPLNGMCPTGTPSSPALQHEVDHIASWQYVAQEEELAEPVLNGRTPCMHLILLLRPHTIRSGPRWRVYATRPLLSSYREHECHTSAAGQQEIDGCWLEYFTVASVRYNAQF